MEFTSNCYSLLDETLYIFNSIIKKLLLLYFRKVGQK